MAFNTTPRKSIVHTTVHNFYIRLYNEWIYCMSNYVLPDAPNTKSYITKTRTLLIRLWSNFFHTSNKQDKLPQPQVPLQHPQTLSNPIRPSSKEHHSRVTRSGVQDNKKRGGMSKLKHNKGQNNNWRRLSCKGGIFFHLALAKSIKQKTGEKTNYTIKADYKKKTKAKSQKTVDVISKQHYLRLPQDFPPLPMVSNRVIYMRASCTSVLFQALYG